ncbi:MAG: hypothetical protein Q8L27_02060, partial [archaeon]|nr:hypothetical protein [archaeon]
DSIVFIVLSSRGCFWAQKGGGCSMCGYVNATNPKFQIKKGAIFKAFKNEYEKQFRNILVKVKVLIYTSGSFFDENEVPIYDRNLIFDYINNRNEIVQVDVETTINFISIEKLQSVKRILRKKLCIAIGLESSNLYIRDVLINKPHFTNKEFGLKCKQIRKFAKLKVNLVLKPMCLTESEAIEDVINSVDFCVKQKADYVYIGGCNIQPNTLSHYLWTKNIYNPPMLISLFMISERLKRKKVEIIYGGFMDYPKPLVEMMCCIKCKEKIIFSFLDKLDKLKLSDINCDCMKKWIKEMNCKNVDSLSVRIKKVIDLLKKDEILS